MMSSDGFLKNSIDSDIQSDHDSEQFIAYPCDTNTKKRDIVDKKLFRQRLRIEFATFYITNENILVKKQVEEVFLMYRKSLVKLFKKYSATKEFDKKNEFANYTHLKHRMNAGETVKFLRDHSISELFIIPDEVVHIIREVNTIIGTPQEECHYLIFQGLEYLILQVAVHLSRKFFYKRKKSKSLAETVLRLFKRMGIEKEEKEIALDPALKALKPSQMILAKNNTVSPVRNYIKAKSRNKEIELDTDDSLSEDQPNKTYELK